MNKWCLDFWIAEAFHCIIFFASFDAIQTLSYAIGWSIVNRGKSDNICAAILCQITHYVIQFLNSTPNEFNWFTMFIIHCETNSTSLFFLILGGGKALQMTQIMRIKSSINDVWELGITWLFFLLNLTDVINFNSFATSFQIC